MYSWGKWKWYNYWGKFGNIFKNYKYIYPSNLIPGVYLKDIPAHSENMVWIRSFITGLFITATTWKQLTCWCKGDWSYNFVSATDWNILQPLKRIKTSSMHWHTRKTDGWVKKKTQNWLQNVRLFCLRKESDMNTYLYWLAITLRDTRKAQKLNRRKWFPGKVWGYRMNEDWGES